MEFKKNNEELSFIEQQFSEEPHINVISKERFEERVNLVFTELWDRLSKSFGPGGAGTFISVYPNYYNTKDGFTIMKNVAFDKKLDQVISDMVMTICTRLNFTVGDGTTTAVIATKGMYDAYQMKKAEFESMHVLPRVIMHRLEVLKDRLIEEIDEMATPIRSDDPEILKANIAKVVDISSNGNKEITDMISDLYGKLMYPAISCTLATDGITKASVVEGYKLDITLTDKIYINNDDNTMTLNSADFLVFDHKVTQDTYVNILKPLSEVCNTYGRHLVCIAPYYDETALSGVIKTDLNRLYAAKKDIPLVLTVCSKVSGFAKTCLDDLSMLLNTMIITPSIEKTLIDNYKKNFNVFEVFNIDNRKIPDICVGVMKNPELFKDGGAPVIRTEMYNENIDDSMIYNNQFEDLFRVGFCKNSVIGLKESSFSGFFYDPSLYEKYLSTAKTELDEVRRKCENIGTFSVQLSEKQKRVYALGLKTGLIEVGSSSELSQGYLKDTFDDAIKAAASAYNNGVVLGCNVTSMRAIRQFIHDNMSELDNLDLMLMDMLMIGYQSVYETVLSNVMTDSKFSDDELNSSMESDTDAFIECVKAQGYPNFDMSENVKGALITCVSPLSSSMSLFKAIMRISIYTNSVFNLSTGKFDKDVINSAETDKEILKATIDLLSLLITGNQLVLR